MLLLIYTHKIMSTLLPRPATGTARPMPSRDRCTTEMALLSSSCPAPGMRPCSVGMGRSAYGGLVGGHHLERGTHMCVCVVCVCGVYVCVCVCVCVPECV